MIRHPRPLPLNPLRPIPTSLQWYVLTTNPNREYTVAHWLEAQGWFTLVPLDKRFKLENPKRGGKNKSRVAYYVPLIPRHVIAGLAAPPPWLTVLSRQHVTGVLGINHNPGRLRHGEPELLRAASHGILDAAATHHPKPGGKALVTAPGPLQGLLVEVGTMQGRKAIISAIFDGFDRKPLPFVMEANVDDLEAA